MTKARFELDRHSTAQHHSMMHQVRLSIIALTIIGTMWGLTSCSAPKDRPAVEHITLPSREVQATLPFVPRSVHQAAVRCLSNELGYRITAAAISDGSGEGRIDAVNDAGDSVRVETIPGRAYQTATVQVFAVSAGGRAGDPERASEILDRIVDTLHGVIK